MAGWLRGGAMIALLCLCAGCGWWGAAKAVKGAKEAEQAWLDGQKSELREKWVAAELSKRETAIRLEREREDAAYERWLADERARREQTLRDAEAAEARIAGYRAAAARHEDEMRTFALKEAPRIWETIQHLRAMVAEQDERIAEMQRTAQESGLAWRGSERYERIYRARNKLVRTQRQVEDRLSEALMAAQRYRASPRRAEVEAATRKALENGVLESEWVWKQYDELLDELQ